MSYDPGPGSYDVETAGQKAAKNNAGLLARSARFKDTINDNPGPATYEVTSLSCVLRPTILRALTYLQLLVFAWCKMWGVYLTVDFC